MNCTYLSNPYCGHSASDIGTNKNIAFSVRKGEITGCDRNG